MNVIEVQPNYRENVKGGNLTTYPSNAGDAIYPIGSLYLTLDHSDVCPLQKLGFGKWERVQSNLCLQTAPSVDKAGNTVKAGLPNIKGNAGVHDDMTFGYPNGTTSAISGCFTTAARLYNYDSTSKYANDGPARTLVLDASRSSSVYGGSDTVQPPAIYVNVWKRVS